MPDEPAERYTPIPFDQLSPELQREVIKTKRVIWGVGIVSIGLIVLMCVLTIIVALLSQQG
jgi:hypothetical protein